MISRTISGALLLVALLFFGASLAMAQEPTPGVKKSTAPRTNAASGVEMFNTYCAVCHGKDAKGDGPLATELKIPPANLTMLAKNHDGKYPTDYVSQVILTGPRDAKSHGSKDMPVWGTVFKSMGDDASVKQRIFNLNKYIETLQAK
ncbi:MAG: cytochrome c [Acidobacteriia bacterium]|nr:cytochrome c [Terriglobia bacterium]